METIVKKITQPKLPKMKNKLTKICNEPSICAVEKENKLLIGQKINHYKYWLKNFVDSEFKIGETI